LDAPLTSDNDSLFAVPLSPRERKVAAGHDPLAPLFEDEPNFKLRWMRTVKQLQELSEALHQRGYRIAMTSGSFDLLHVGHSMYLQEARSYGDFLIVGVDSDAKIKERKGPDRPLIPEDERLKMLAYQRAVGAMFLKEPSHKHKRWAMIKAVRPDVLVVTAETYTPEEVAELKKRFRCEVQVLPRMAMVSTSGRVRSLQLGHTEGDRPFDIFVQDDHG
jgi:D-beta-D-heptose 7-phosphate kinase/D-beta-D-heptose 1-phosphate adenosyltransferase